MRVELWCNALNVFLKKGHRRGRHGAPPLVRDIATRKYERVAPSVVVGDLEIGIGVYTAY